MGRDGVYICVTQAVYPVVIALFDYYFRITLRGKEGIKAEKMCYVIYGHHQNIENNCNFSAKEILGISHSLDQ